jgi:hypothetical protein
LGSVLAFTRGLTEYRLFVYSGLTNYFKAVRAAFSDRSIRRGLIVAEGNYIACQTLSEDLPNLSRKK